MRPSSASLYLFLSACSRVAASSLVTPRPVTRLLHYSFVTCHFSCHCRCPNLQLPLSPLLPYATLDFTQRPAQTSPVCKSAAIPFPSAGRCFRFNCLAFDSLEEGKRQREKQDLGCVNCLALPCLPLHATHAHHPSALLLLSRRPWAHHSVSSFHARLIHPVPHHHHYCGQHPLLHRSLLAFHISLFATPLPPSTPQSVALARLCVPCCVQLSLWFDFSSYFFYRPGIVAQSPQHLQQQQQQHSTARLSQHSAVQCGSSIGTFFLSSPAPSLPPSRLAHSLAGSHLPMELAK